MSISIDYDIGCNYLTQFLGLNITNQTSEFHPYRAGRILTLPQPNIVFQPQKWYNVHIALETYGEGDSLLIEHQTTAMRNESRVFTSVGLNDEVLRYDTDMSVGTDDDGWTGKNYSMKTRVKVREGLIDALMSVHILKRNYPYTPGQDALGHFSVAYTINVYRAQKTPPIITIDNCNYFEPDPDHDGDTIVFYRIYGKPGCFRVHVDGYPLPEFAVAEMINPVTTRRMRQKNLPKSKMATNNLEFFHSAPLAKGQVKNFQVVAVNSQGFVSQEFRLQAFEPTHVTVSQNITVIETNGTEVRIFHTIIGWRTTHGG